MDTFLEKILERKRGEISKLRGKSFHGRSSPKRGFIESLDVRPRLAIIAEVKKASPSKGMIRHDFDPAAIAGQYEKGGAAAISVLTDETYFQGHAEHLIAVRETVGLPVLRKDFIIDPIQVEEAAHINADAVLLIAEALDQHQLDDLCQAARGLELEALIELHGIRQLDKVMRLEPRVIGINNRDLFSFATDLNTTVEIMGHVPKEVLVVAESGIRNAADARRLADAGVCALLVGESLMRAPDPAALVKELML